jgi:hypothetical protein
MSLQQLAVTLALAVFAVGSTAAASPSYEPGVVREYDAKLTLDAVFAGGFGDHGDKSMPSTVRKETLALQIDGKLAVVVASDGVDGALAHLSLLDARLGGTMNEGAVGQAELGDTARELAAGVVVKLGADGLVRSVDADRIGDPFAAQLLRFLVHYAQVKTPPSQTATSWTAEEQDSTGIYDASYQVVGRNGASSTFVKVKTGYKQIDFKLAGSAIGKKPGGTVTGTSKGSVSSRDGWLLTLEGEETAVVFFESAMQPLSTARTVVKLARRGERRMTEGERTAALQKASMAPSASKGSTSAPSATALETARRTLGKDTPTVLARIGKEIDAAKAAPTVSETVLFMKIRAFLTLHPDRVDEIERLYAGQAEPNAFFRASLLALSKVPSDGCGAALRRAVEAADKAGDWMTAVFALPLLTELPPSKENEELIRKLREQGSRSEIHDSAHLALGAVADRVKTVDPERADRIVDEYAAVEQGKGKGDRKLAIEVLGNTSSERLPDVLDTAMRDPDESIRATAVYSLRGATSQKATKKMLELAVADKSPKVRKAAYEAMSHRPDLLPHMPVLIERLGKDEDVDVRHALIGVLARYYEAVAEVKKVIDHAAAKDKDASVREYARSIAPGDGQAPAMIQ